MKKSNENIRTLAGKIFLGGSAVAIALAGCDTQLAGSSVGTGNPTEIQLGFTQGGSTVAISGRVELFAATQVPIPGFSPLPLASVAVADGKSATFTAKAVGAIADSLWPKTSVDGDSICRFNLVVSGASQGAILTGFGYRKGKGEFSIRAEDAAAPRAEDAEVVTASLSALSDINYVIDSTRLSQDKQSYLFLYGTGFSAQGLSGRFVFRNLPQGDYVNHLVAVPGKDHIVSGEDSAYVLETTNPIHSGVDILLSVGSIEGAIPLPDSLLTH